MLASFLFSFLPRFHPWEFWSSAKKEGRRGQTMPLRTLSPLLPVLFAVCSANYLLHDFLSKIGYPTGPRDFPPFLVIDSLPTTLPPFLLNFVGISYSLSKGCIGARG